MDTYWLNSVITQWHVKVWHGMTDSHHVSWQRRRIILCNEVIKINRIESVIHCVAITIYLGRSKVGESVPSACHHWSHHQ